MAPWRAARRALATAPAAQAALGRAIAAPDALRADREAASALQARARAKNTIAAYDSAWRGFVGWCEESDVAPFPARGADVAAYLAHLATEGLALATIEIAYAAIAFTERAAGAEGWPSPRGTPPEVQLAMAGIRRTIGAPSRGKAPITDRELPLLVRAEADRGLPGARNVAMLLVGFMGAFRRGEIVALDVEHVEWDEEGLRITLPRSKTDQEGKGVVKGLPYAGDPALCPVRTLHRWLEDAGIESGPLFRRFHNGRVCGADTRHHGRLSDRAVANVIKAACERAGLDPTDFSGHSLRAGFVTTAAKRGKSLDAIMRQTDHTDVRTVRKYIRFASLFVDNAAAGLF